MMNTHDGRKLSLYNDTLVHFTVRVEGLGFKARMENPKQSWTRPDGGVRLKPLEICVQ
jgi:hypothetical protein